LRINWGSKGGIYSREGGPYWRVALKHKGAELERLPVSKNGFYTRFVERRCSPQLFELKEA